LEADPGFWEKKTAGSLESSFHKHYNSGNNNTTIFNHLELSSTLFNNLQLDANIVAFASQRRVAAISGSKTVFMDATHRGASVARKEASHEQTQIGL
jgi:hypothetical protein